MILVIIYETGCRHGMVRCDIHGGMGALDQTLVNIGDRSADITIGTYIRMAVAYNTAFMVGAYQTIGIISSDQINLHTAVFNQSVVVLYETVVTALRRVHIRILHMTVTNNGIFTNLVGKRSNVDTC